MSRSLRMNRAATVFFLPDGAGERGGGGVVLAGLAGGVAAAGRRRTRRAPGRRGWPRCQAGTGRSQRPGAGENAPLTCSSMTLTCSLRAVITAIRDRTVAA